MADTLSNKSLQDALFALKELPVKTELCTSLEEIRTQLTSTLVEIEKRHTILSRITQNAKLKSNILVQEVAHLEEQKKITEDILYTFLSIESNEVLISYLQSKKAQLKHIKFLQFSIDFEKAHKKTTQDYLTVKELFIWNIDILAELDRVYQEDISLFESTWGVQDQSETNRWKAVDAFQELLELPQIKVLVREEKEVGDSIVEDLIVEDSDAEIPWNEVTLAFSKTQWQILEPNWKTDQPLAKQALITQKTITQEPNELIYTPTPTVSNTAISLGEKWKKSRSRRGPTKKIPLILTEAVTEYKVKKDRELYMRMINTYKFEHKHLYDLAKATENMKANSRGYYDFTFIDFSAGSLAIKNTVNTITKGKLSHVKNSAKIRDLGSKVALQYISYPVVDTKNRNGSYEMINREIQNRIYETQDKNKNVDKKPTGTPSINLNRLRNLKKITDGTLHIPQKMNYRKMTQIITGIAEIINQAYTQISPKARTDESFNFSEQKELIEQLTNYVEESMNMINSVVDKWNGLLKIVSYSNLVTQLLYKKLYEAISVNTDKNLYYCTNRVLFQFTLMLEGELYKDFWSKFNLKEFELVEKIHVYQEAISKKDRKDSYSKLLGNVYAFLNTIHQRINIQSIVTETFDTKNEEIWEEGRKLIAQRYAKQFAEFSIKSKMYSAPEVITRWYGVNNVEHLFWLKEIDSQKYAGMLLLGDIDIFINVESREHTLDELCIKTWAEKEEISYFSSPLPFVKKFDELWTEKFDIISRGKAWAVFLHRDGSMSLNWEDVEDLKYIIDSKTYYMLQAYILYQILESHNIIDKRKDNPVFWWPRLHTQEREAKDVIRKDPRIIYNSPEVRDSWITRNVTYRSETHVRHYKKDLFTADEFITHLEEKKLLKVGIYRINEHGDPYFEELEFDINRLPLPLEIHQLLEIEDALWAKSIITDMQWYIREASAFIKLQHMIKKAVELKREWCAFYPKYYRSEHRKPWAKKTPKTVYQIFWKSINQKPSETEVANIAKLLNRQPTYVKDLYLTLEKRLTKEVFPDSDLQRRSHSNQIHCIKDKKPLFSLSLANFIIAHLYIDMSNEIDSNVVIKDSSSIDYLLSLLKQHNKFNIENN